MQIQKGAKVNLIKMSPVVQGTVQAVSKNGALITVKYREVLQHKSWRGRAMFSVKTVQLPASDVQIALAWRDGSAHSQKGLKTLEAMGVDPESVAHVFIKYVVEVRDVTAHFYCECCRGSGAIMVPGRLAAGLEEVAKPNAYYDFKNADGSKLEDYQTGDGISSVAVKCPKGCSLGYCYGMVNTKCPKQFHGITETRPIKFTVGYPQWSKGVVFDSRFNNGRRQCQLCAKAIPSGLFAPIEAKDAQGNAHGLWVGLDCARKFTGYNTEHEVLDGTNEVICQP